jgi:hypothetical protein
MRTKTNTSKRILSVKLRKMADDCQPDTSWLGEYSDRRTSDFSIDRAHAEDCVSVVPLSEDGQRILKNARAYIAEEQSKLADADSAEGQDYEDAYYLLDGLTETPECDCGESGDMERGQYRYFNPSFNYVTKEDKPADNLTPEDVRNYVRQDYERMKRFNQGSWCFVGVRAEASYVLQSWGRWDASANMFSGGCGPIQELTSGGLFGIESDSSSEYIADVSRWELADLKTQLLALGFSKRAISNAFKSVSEVNS